MVSVFQGGCFFGALFAFSISERFGRKKPILGSATLFVLGSFLQIWANGRLNLMYVGRTLNGLGVGIASCLVPIYIAEFSPPAIRGRIVGIYEIMYQIAAFIGLVLPIFIELRGLFTVQTVFGSTTGPRVIFLTATTISGVFP